MMARRKEAMARTRRRRRKDIDITASDDYIMNLISKMRLAAEQDRQLNLARKPATKKLQLLPTLLASLKKCVCVWHYYGMALVLCCVLCLQGRPSNSLHRVWNPLRHVCEWCTLLISQWHTCNLVPRPSPLGVGFLNLAIVSSCVF